MVLKKLYFFYLGEILFYQIIQHHIYLKHKAKVGRGYFLYQILTIVQSMLFPHVSDYCRRLFVGGGNVHVDDR